MVTEYAPNLRQPARQLLWNAKILTQLDYNRKPEPTSARYVGQQQSSYRHDGVQLSRMQEKLTALREQKTIDEDRISNLIDLINKFNLIETTNMEFYG